MLLRKYGGTITHSPMRIYLLDRDPPYLETGLDPRRRHLYGENVVWLSPRKNHSEASGSTSVIEVGEYWQPRKPWHLMQRAASDLGERVESFRAIHADGVLIVGCHQLAVPLLRRGVKFAFDPTDSSTLFYLRRALALWKRYPIKAANSLRLAIHYGVLERTIGEKAGLFLTTGPADELFLRRLSPAANILRVANGTSFIDEPPVPVRDDERTIGFHGGMNWEPNRMTAERIAGPIAASLDAMKLGPLRIRVAGQPVPPALAVLDARNGVEVCGFVENLREWMSTLSLYVMPMYQGAGVKNKLIEALAMGVPVLTNSLGAEAIPADDRKILEVAESDAELVKLIPRLLSDRTRLRAMRQEGRRYAESHFDWSDHSNKLKTEMNRLKQAGQL